MSGTSRRAEEQRKRAQTHRTTSYRGGNRLFRDTTHLEERGIPPLTEKELEYFTAQIYGVGKSEEAEPPEELTIKPR